VSMIRRQRTRSLVFLQAEWTPMFGDYTSASIIRSQVVRGRPRGLLQSRGFYPPILDRKLGAFPSLPLEV